LNMPLTSKPWLIIGWANQWGEVKGKKAKKETVQKQKPVVPVTENQRLSKTERGIPSSRGGFGGRGRGKNLGMELEHTMGKTLTGNQDLREAVVQRTLAIEDQNQVPCSSNVMRNLVLRTITNWGKF
jgi:hypothetical protein